MSAAPSRVLTSTLLAFVCMLGWTLQPDGASAASSPALSRISVTARDLGAGFRLVAHGGFATHASGQTKAMIWTYADGAAATTPAVVRLVNWIADFKTRPAAAEDLILAFGRTCGGHEQSFSYHGISAQIGDFAEGCYYPYTLHGKHKSPAVVFVLRRYSYVTEVRGYGTRALGDMRLEGIVEHLLAIVDRRIELAQHGKTAGKKSKKRGSTKPFVRISSCKRPCFFDASGRGSTMAPSRYRGSPKKFQFSAPPTFRIAYKYDCGHSIRDQDTFYLTLLDDSGQSMILKGEPFQRDNGVLTAGLGTGARRAVLRVVVQNNSCTWSVKAYRFGGNTQP